MIRTLQHGIERINAVIGRAASWLALAMVLVGSFNAIARWLDRYTGLDLSANTYLEMQWYMFSAMFLLAGAWALGENAHVRVDVFYARISRRAQAWVNVIGVVLLLVPFCVMMVIVSWASLMHSVSIHEMSPDPGGLPRYPLRAVVPLAFVLVLLQGLALAIGEVLTIIGRGPTDEEASRAAQEGRA